METYQEQKNGILKNTKTGGVFFPKFLQEKIDSGDVVVLPYEESEEEKQQAIEIKKASERSWRDSLLDPLRYEIDVIEDAGGDASHLRKYRQQLKDYPNQQDFPENERPVKP